MEARDPRSPHTLHAKHTTIWSSASSNEARATIPGGRRRRKNGRAVIQVCSNAAAAAEQQQQCCGAVHETKRHRQPHILSPPNRTFVKRERGKVYCTHSLPTVCSCLVVMLSYLEYLAVHLTRYYSTGQEMKPPSLTKRDQYGLTMLHRKPIAAAEQHTTANRT